MNINIMMVTFGRDANNHPSIIIVMSWINSITPSLFLFDLYKYHHQSTKKILHLGDMKSELPS